jgi:hypothetical protein
MDNCYEIAKSVLSGNTIAPMGKLYCEELIRRYHEFIYGFEAVSLRDMIYYVEVILSQLYQKNY